MIGLFVVLMLSVELWFPLLDEAILLALESLELVLDKLYEKGLGLDNEAAQQATAWTGLFLAVSLTGLFLYKLPVIAGFITAFLAKRWAIRKQAIKIWWPMLDWRQKLAHIAVLGLFLGGLVMLV